MNGGPPGDLYVQVHIKPHPVFQRDHDDLHCEMPISIATAAAAGPGSLLVWLGAFLFFYIPLAMAVLELSSRHPDEGGLYAWSRRQFGDLAGFLAGWISVTVGFAAPIALAAVAFGDYLAGAVPGLKR